MSLTTLLLVLFVALKLTGYICWSWLWVLSPLWITALIVFGIYAVAGMVCVTALKVDKAVK